MNNKKLDGGIGLRQRFSGIKRFTSIFLCAVILYFISMYWVFSNTLFSYDFYNNILSSEKVFSSFYNTSLQISEHGLTRMGAKSLKENILSVADGIIRYITQKDMTLSDISIEENSITLMVDSARTNNVYSEFPEISHIHPYALLYFVPESNILYFYLSLVQKGYAVYRFLSPAFCFIGLLVILLSKKVTGNLRAVLISATAATGCTGFWLLLFHKPLLVHPLSNTLGLHTSLLNPFVQEVCLALFIKIIKLCLVFILAALMTKIKSVDLIIGRSARNTALILVIFAGLFLILYRNEIATSVNNTVYNTMSKHAIYTLDKDDGTVHSLTIKLKEDHTNEPIPDIQLVLLKTDYSYRTSAYSDTLGNTRFILPQGDYLLYANKSTVPNGLVCFEPVVISLTSPDSSWYTFHLAKVFDEDLNLGIQNQQISENVDPLLP